MNKNVLLQVGCFLIMFALEMIAACFDPELPADGRNGRIAVLSRQNNNDLSGETRQGLFCCIIVETL